MVDIAFEMDLQQLSLLFYLEKGCYLYHSMNVYQQFL